MRLAFLAALLALTAAANAAETGKITVEFNDLQPAETGCRAVFVLNNGFGKPLDKMTLRIVAFDAKDHATLFLSLDVGPLPVGKTRVVRFDLAQTVGCADVSRIVLDDITACTGAAVTPAACLAALALSSKAGIKFDF